MRLNSTSNFIKHSSRKVKAFLAVSMPLVTAPLNRYIRRMSDPASAIVLPPDLQGYISSLDATDAHARRLLDGLSDRQANWQPDVSRWSIAMCLDHLALTSESYLAALTTAAANARPGHRSLQPAGWFSRFFLKKTEPPATLKIKAPKNIQPAAAIPAQQALAHFLAANDAVRSFARTTAHLDLCSTRFRNPFVRGLNFTVATGLLIICAHNRRHLWQADQVRQSRDFPR